MKRLMCMVFLASVLAGAQQTATTPPSGAKAEDVANVDGIVKALYQVISGPAGPRDWERFRALFTSGARLVATGKAPDGSVRARVITPEEYVERAGQAFAKEGFFESEKARRSEQFGSIAQVFSTYESRRAADGAAFERGINSIQLFNDGKRWWIVSVLWGAESAENPIPEKYLK